MLSVFCFFVFYYDEIVWISGNIGLETIDDNSFNGYPVFVLID